MGAAAISQLNMSQSNQFPNFHNFQSLRLYDIQKPIFFSINFPLCFLIDLLEHEADM